MKLFLAIGPSLEQIGPGGHPLDPAPPSLTPRLGRRTLGSMPPRETGRSRTKDGPPFNRTVRDRLDLIEPLVRGRATLDLGVVDARPQRQTAVERIAYKADLLFKRLAEVNPEIVGLDIDPDGCEELRRQGYDVVCGDVETMDLDRTFQTIVAGEIIEHLENPGLFLRNVRRHLTDDGLLVVTTPNPFYVGSTWKIWRYGRPAVHEEHLSWQDPTTLDQLLARTGFRPVDGAWVQPRRNPIKTWKRFLRPYFSHGFVRVAAKGPE